MSTDHITDDLLTALEEAAERGVEVRVLFDHIGTLRVKGYRNLLKRLKASKIQWRRMLPLLPIHGQWRRPDLRNHRKIMVIDGEVAFTGSQNLIEPSYNNPKHRKAGREWVELMACLRGPIVTTLNVVFATDWLSETDESLEAPAAAARPDPTSGQRHGPGGAQRPRVHHRKQPAPLQHADLLRPAPDFHLQPVLRPGRLAALRHHHGGPAGRGRGAVRLGKGRPVPGPPRPASYYEALLEAGVRIYLYKAPFVLHAKHFTIDDEVAVLGSSNMDMRSFSLNMEVSVMLLGRGHRERACARWKTRTGTFRSELKLEDWLQRPLAARYMDNVARLTATVQ